MSRRKGELSPSRVDRGWPFQIAVPESEMRKHPFDEWERAKRRLNACLLGHFVRYEDQDWYVVCFATAEAALAFKAQFNGVNFDPADRGKGAYWFKWKRPAKEPPLGGRQIFR